MRLLFIVFCVLCLTLSAGVSMVFGQLSQPNRFEVGLGLNESPYTVINGEGVLFLFRRIEDAPDQSSQMWEVLKLDTTLQMIWKNTYSIAKEFVFAKHYYHKNDLQLLFTNSTGNKTNLELITINTNTGKGIHHPIDNLIPFNLTEFKTSRHGALIGGYYNYRPLILYYHFATNKTKVLPGFYHEKSELVQVKINTDETVDVILSGTSFRGRKNRILDIKTFDFSGDLISNTLLDKTDEKSLLYGRSCDWDGDTKLIAGTYGRRNSEYSRGLYLANVNKYGEHKINFYNYGDLKNFFSYMRSKRETRVQNRIERRKEKNKKIKFNYRLLIHDVFQKDGQYIMLGEAFYPKYIHPSGASTAGLFQNGRGTSPESVFDGYRYTHAVVLGFDINGKLLWDNSFEITDVKTFEREQFVKASVEKDRIILLYLYDNVIRSKIIKENEVLEGKTFDNLKLKFENDVARSNGSNKMNGLEKWYDNTFYAYGVQVIKKKGIEGSGLDRRVFFLNKIVYR